MQYRFLNYKEDDKTFVLNSRLVGLIEPGCYRGFDMTKRGDLNLELSHGTTGVPYVDAQAVVTPPRGVVFTRQGTIIMEDESIILEISSGDVQPRIDLVICNHNHVQLAGGKTAYYSIIKGVAAAVPVPPVLATPGSQTIVGSLYVPANAANLAVAGVKWTVNRPEMSGRQAYELPATVAHWDREQAWNQRQFFKALAYEIVEPGEGVARVTPAGVASATGEVVRLTTATGIVYLLSGGGRVSSIAAAGRELQMFYLRVASTTALVRGGLQLPAPEIVMQPGDVAQFILDENGSALLLGMYHGDTARTKHVNRFEAIQQLGVGQAEFVSFASPVGTKDRAAGIRLGLTGNTYQVEVPPGLNARIAFLTTMPEGTEVTLYFPRGGRPDYQQISVDALPDFCLEDMRNRGEGQRAGYQMIRLLAEAPAGGFITGRVRIVPQRAGCLIKLVSLGGNWIVVSTSESLPMHATDRRLLKFDPISGGPGNVPIPFTGQPATVLHEYVVPYAVRRDYLFHHSMVVAQITTKPELSVSFYRNRIRQREFGFVSIPTNGHSTIISTSFLFEACEPGEVLQVRIDRRDGSSNQIALYNSTLSLDGTPNPLG